jgi:hypothetical protein
MIAGGVSLRAVQMIGGWSTFRMVERYAHVNDAELARAVQVTHAHTESARHAPAKNADSGEADSGEKDGHRRRR